MATLFVEHHQDPASEWLRWARGEGDGHDDGKTCPSGTSRIRSLHAGGETANDRMADGLIPGALGYQGEK